MSDARLVVTVASGASTDRVLGEELRIGRSADNDVVLDDPRVSRRHALVRRLSSGEFIVVDLGSANGTELNGESLLLPTRLKSNDVLRIGTCSLRFLSDTAESSATDDAESTRVEDHRDTPNLLGTGPAMAEVFRLLDHAASSTLPLLILGETGTGKELVARAAHAGSARRSQPFVVVSCAGLSEAALESELFGAASGSAKKGESRPGLLEAASGGSLFLDEVADLPAALQARLLRVLEGGELATSGGAGPAQVDVRVISATNRDLAKEVEIGRFRADLFYRLAGFSIRVPPLRERREDIPLLCERFLQTAAERNGKRLPGIDEDALELLTWFDWPGNVRELRNEIERAVVVAKDGSRIDLGHLSSTVLGTTAVPEAKPSMDAAPISRKPTRDTPIPEPQGENVFRCDGEFWTLVYSGTKSLLKDNKGLHHIARLLASPGTEHSAQALALEVEGEMEAPPGVGQGRHETGESIASSLGDAGPALDARAKAEYRRRLKELNDDLEEAERNNDLGRAERIRMELEFVAQQVSSAVGLAGRDRPTGSHAERARLLVTQRIKASLKRITESHPALGDHLSQSLKTGQRCVYQPGDVPIDWQT